MKAIMTYRISQWLEEDFSSEEILMIGKLMLNNKLELYFQDSSTHLMTALRILPIIQREFFISNSRIGLKIVMHL